MKIKAALSTGASEPFAIEEVDLDDPRDDEVVVRVDASGVCHTDLTMKAAWPAAMSPIVLGHEGAGVVEAVGAGVSTVKAGDRVLMSYRSCGACPECSSGHPTYCHNFQALNAIGSRPDGTTTMRRGDQPVYGSFFGQSSFASHAIAYESNVVKVGDDTDLLVAAPLGCGIQTGAGAVLNVLQPGADDAIVVFGAGGVGLAAVMAAKAAGVKTIIAVDPVESRRQAAADVGATETIDPAAGDEPAAVIREITGHGASHALDTTAIPAVINGALDALAARGTLALVGVGAPEVAINVQGVIGGGKTIRGVIEGDAKPQEFLPRLLDLHAKGELPLERLIKTYAFDDIGTAVADASSGSTIKPVLVL